MDRKALADFFDRRTAVFLAVTSGAFSFAVIAALSWFALAHRFPDYLDAEELLSVKEELRKDYSRDDLKGAYRADDLARRRAFVSARAKLRLGGFLLLAGLVVLALSMKRVAQLTERPTVPARPEGRKVVERRRRFAFASAGGFSGAVVIGAFAVAVAARWSEQAADGADVPTEIVEEVPDALRWPRFHGPTGMGIAPEGEYPVTWDAATGANVVWKTRVPLEGNSSPVVWGSRVFLTGATRRERKLFCFDRASGTLKWQCRIETRAVVDPEMEVGEDTGLAAPTPVTDGRRVYVFFGTNELAAVDFHGRQVWARWLGEPESAFGIAASPVLHGGKLILQHDQAESAFLYAFDPETGDELWRTKRDVKNSWSTPVVFDTGAREELVTCSDPWVISYDPATGSELWRAEALSGDVAPSPVSAGGFVYTVTEYSELSAIRAGGAGDVTKSHVAWTYDEELPDVASPVTDGKLYLHATGSGIVVCLNAEKGTVLWTRELEGEMFWSSPTLAGGLVYLTGRKGVTRVFALGDEYVEKGRGAVGERVVATPAFVDSRIYIRGKEHLFCVAEIEDE